MSLTVHLALVFHVFIVVTVMVMVCGRRGIKGAYCISVDILVLDLGTGLNYLVWPVHFSPSCLTGLISSKGRKTNHWLKGWETRSWETRSQTRRKGHWVFCRYHR